MSAYFDTGFSVRKPSWHGKATVLADYPTDWADARVKAGLTWEPELRPMYQHRAFVDPVTVADFAGAIPLGGFTDADCTLTRDLILPVPNKKLVVRNDTEFVLGDASDSFTLIEHSVMGEILEAVLGIENVKFETAGSIKMGATVWALAYLDEPMTVAGDDTETYPFVALINHHDGSGACKLINTDVRVICWNTTQAAEMQGERSGRQFVFRHTGDVLGRIEEAKAAIAGVRDDAKEWDTFATELFGMSVSDEIFADYLVEFIPDPPADILSERVRGNIERARSVFKSLYLESVTTEAHRGTALGIVDASVEYLDHVRGYRNSDTYLGRTLLRPEPLKAKAVHLIRELCNA